MKFEDALAALRIGGKIWHPGMADDEYYMACRITLLNNIVNLKPEEMPMSIVFMKSGKQYPQLGFPMMNLLWVMSEQWKILGGIN